MYSFYKVQLIISQKSYYSSVFEKNALALQHQWINVETKI